MSQAKRDKMSPYSSSLTDEEWAIVEAMLNELLPKKKQTRPQKRRISIISGINH
jgi:transposase